MASNKTGKRGLYLEILTRVEERHRFCPEISRDYEFSTLAVVSGDRTSQTAHGKCEKCG
jgi:hypothetical protein